MVEYSYFSLFNYTILTIPMIYFASDIHLGYNPRSIDKALETQFVRWLHTIEKDDTLVLLGDIFDYWFEYKYVIPAYYYRTLSAISDLVDGGIEVEYVMGNHDFGHKHFFQNEFGIEVITTDLERVYYGKRFYLSHGDGKAYNDTNYLILRKILRNRVCQVLFSLLHPDIGIPIALSSSRSSRKHTSQKHFGKLDGMHDFAQQKIGDGFDYVIMGHRHLAEQTTYNINGRVGQYINLGGWLEEPYFAQFDGENMKLLPLQSK
ncbi:MAG: UDP-2,3-diacylglucosamine diphosphatase [Ignavibacteria bacterium]|jgi:UDP-2,3-diacylglucosamine hydrolase|nr:UDP-2,3-diacylglucosamine diphosphatase [Ignavibacteria bacterium]